MGAFLLNMEVLDDTPEQSFSCHIFVFVLLDIFLASEICPMGVCFRSLQELAEKKNLSCFLC